MALIPIFFTIANEVKILQNSNVVAAGQLVTLATDTSANAEAEFPVAVLAGGASPVGSPIGLAADSVTAAGATLGFASGTTNFGYAANVTVNQFGGQMLTQNRVSDMYNETLASGMLTVYSGTGVFRTTIYDAVTYTPGQPLYSSATTAGSITNVNTSTQRIGTVVTPPTQFPSGVPGTDIDGSTSLGTFLTLQLLV